MPVLMWRGKTSYRELSRIGAEQWEVTMLGAHPISPVLLATDLAAARDFYHDQLGLQILSESEAAITLRCGVAPS